LKNVEADMRIDRFIEHRAAERSVVSDRNEHQSIDNLSSFALPQDGHEPILPPRHFSIQPVASFKNLAEIVNLTTGHRDAIIATATGTLDGLAANERDEDALIAVQFVRYIIVGVVSNGLLYLGYLLVTWFGLGHKLTMTLMFGIGVLQTFHANRAWSFRSANAPGRSLAKYAFVSAIGYVINWIGLWVFVDRLGYPHQGVQLVMICVVAVFIFANLKLWVFAPRDPAREPRLPTE
jgi:putative flippase GtrA